MTETDDRWIPVTEQRPPSHSFFALYDDGHVTLNSGAFARDTRIRYWMPITLPKPISEEEMAFKAEFQKLLDECEESLARTDLRTKESDYRRIWLAALKFASDHFDKL
jgi:hypothetical protein